MNNAPCCCRCYCTHTHASHQPAYGQSSLFLSCQLIPHSFLHAHKVPCTPTPTPRTHTPAAFLSLLHAAAGPDVAPLPPALLRHAAVLGPTYAGSAPFVHFHDRCAPFNKPRLHHSALQLLSFVLFCLVYLLHHFLCIGLRHSANSWGRGGGGLKLTFCCAV